MRLSEAYWVLILLWVVSAAWWGVTTPAPGRWPIWGGSLILFLLLLVIGLRVFGGPIQGG